MKKSKDRIENRKTFYKKAGDALISKGYKYIDEKDIKGKGPSHNKKPDYIAEKDDTVLIGETKSPSEGPKSSSWRDIQNSDSNEFISNRLQQVAVRTNQNGLVAPSEKLTIASVATIVSLSVYTV